MQISKCLIRHYGTQHEVPKSTSVGENWKLGEKEKKGIVTSHTCKVHTVFTQNEKKKMKKAFETLCSTECGYENILSSVHKFHFVQYVCRNKAIALFLLTFTMFPIRNATKIT